MDYFIADTHFSHKNIIEYESRPFNSPHEMNEAIIARWNSTVQTEDTVYFLGDFAFANQEATIGLCNRLNGNKIIILGNHDTRGRDFWTNRCGFIEFHKGPTEYIRAADHYLLSHEPIEDSEIPNCHGHCHSRGPNDAMHFCVSVEMIDYTPIAFDKIQDYFYGRVAQ